MIDRFPTIRRDWDGAGSFGALLDQLDLGRCKRILEAPGYLYDPQVSPAAELPNKAAADNLSAELGLLNVVKRVSQLTDVPELTPTQYDAVFAEIAAEINANGYHLSRVSKAVRDRFQHREHTVPRSAINYILKGIAFAGHEFDPGSENPRRLAEAFYASVLNVCSLAQIDLTPAEEIELRMWITGEDSAVNEVAA